MNKMKFINLLLFACNVVLISGEPFNGFQLRSLHNVPPNINLMHHSPINQHQQHHHHHHQLAHQSSSPPSPSSFNNNDLLLHQLIQRKSDQLASQIKPTVGPVQVSPQRPNQHLSVQSATSALQPATSDSANLVTDLLANRLAEDLARLTEQVLRSKDLKEEVMLLEEKLKMEKMMREKLEQHEMKLREERILQEKLREEKRKIEQLLAEEKAKREEESNRAALHKQQVQQQQQKQQEEAQQQQQRQRPIDADDLLSTSGLLDSTSSESGINLKTLASLAANGNAGESDKWLSAASAAASELLEESGGNPLASSLSSSLGELQSSSSLSAALAAAGVHSNGHHALSQLSSKGPMFPSQSVGPSPFGHHASPGSPYASAASSPFSSAFLQSPPVPSRMSHHGPPPPPPPAFFSSPPHAPSGSSPLAHRAPMPIPFGARMQPPHPSHFSLPHGARPMPPSPMSPFAAAASMANGRLVPPPTSSGHTSPFDPARLHSIAASMYPSLYANSPFNPNARSSSPNAGNPANQQMPNGARAHGPFPGPPAPVQAASPDANGKDQKSGKIKSLLMDFAVSSILDVGMSSLVGNLLGKMGDSTA